MVDDTERVINAPPPELRFGIRRVGDGELLAYGTTASLRRFFVEAGLEVDAYRVVRLSRKRRRR